MYICWGGPGELRGAAGAKHRREAAGFAPAASVALVLRLLPHPPGARESLRGVADAYFDVEIKKNGELAQCCAVLFQR